MTDFEDTGSRRIISLSFPEVWHRTAFALAPWGGAEGCRLCSLFLNVSI